MQGAHWSTLALLWILQCSCFYTTETGLIQCTCSTSDCQRDGKVSCQAENVCYVQVMPSPSDRPAAGSVVRGCIDDRTPLLCENRRPLTYTGPWPVLLCCKENWCNRNIEPTLPSWVDHIQGHSEDHEGDAYDGHDDDNITSDEDSDDLSHYDNDAVSSDDDADWYAVPDSATSSHRLATNAVRGRPAETDDIKLSQFVNKPSRRLPAGSYPTASWSINPLYIGIPVAGACVLLGLVIFAIFVLKRRGQTLVECPYKTTLLEQHMAHCIAASHRPGVVTGVTSEPASQRTCNHADCDRSSSGSETILLMKA